MHNAVMLHPSEIMFLHPFKEQVHYNTTITAKGIVLKLQQKWLLHTNLLDYII